MPSLQETLQEVQAEIMSWSSEAVGSQTWLRNRKKAALEALWLIQSRMLVDHKPISSSIKEGDDNGTQFQTATCQICGRDVDRFEDVDNNGWEAWRTIPEAARCFGLVQA